MWKANIPLRECGKPIFFSENVENCLMKYLVTPEIFTNIWRLPSLDSHPPNYQHGRCSSPSTFLVHIETNLYSYSLQWNKSVGDIHCCRILCHLLWETISKLEHLFYRVYNNVMFHFDSMLLLHTIFRPKLGPKSGRFFKSEQTIERDVSL